MTSLAAALVARAAQRDAIRHAARSHVAEPPSGAETARRAAAAHRAATYAVRRAAETMRAAHRTAAAHRATHELADPHPSDDDQEPDQ